MRRPRLLDLMCGEGGCSEGFHRAGFDVVGVDIERKDRYPFPFYQRDALDVLRELVARGRVFGYDRIHAAHASPPCPSYSKRFGHLAKPKPKLIDEVRDLLNQTGLPWVIENVEGAPLATATDLFGNHGATLCGSAFGLRVYRHRLFESNFPLDGVPCIHREPAMNPHNQAGRDRIYAEFGRRDPEIVWQNEMGVGWMSRRGARDAIPPAYTEFIGAQLMQYLQAERVAA